MTNIVLITATCLALSVFGAIYAEHLNILRRWDEARDVTFAVQVVCWVSLLVCMFVAAMEISLV